MSDTSTIARPYAQAIFEIASGEGALTKWADALGVLAEIVADDDASAFLLRPDLDHQARVEFVSGIGAQTDTAEPIGSERGQNFLRLLIENDRLAALPDIADRFNALKAAAENTVKVTLVTATDADTDVADRIAANLEKKLGRKVELELEIDGELLGGAVIRAEDMVIDGSVKTRLRQLAEALIS